MKSVDLSPLKHNDQEFEKLAYAVEKQFKCKWDDAVHDSYGIYVREIMERTQIIHKIRCRAEELAKEAEALKIDDLVKQAKNLCKEADEI